MTPGPDQRFEAGVPKTLFDFPTVGYVPSSNLFIYSPTKDGSRFLADVQISDSQTAVNVVTNWEQLLTTTQLH